MFFFMILGIILTAIGLSSLLETYSPEIIQSSFLLVAVIALVLGLIGLFKLEPRQVAPSREIAREDRTAWKELFREVLASSQARRFFLYLSILLAAILGQDVLLEPFGAEAFGLSVQATTRITSIWGTSMLLSLVAASFLERWIPKKKVAFISAWIAFAGFILITVSGFLKSTTFFYSGVVFLGLGTGASTVSNLSLMLDMTTTRVGLFMGAWGVANAVSRFIGTLMGGMVRDFSSSLFNNAVYGYLVVFVVEAIMLLVSVILLRKIDVASFKKQVDSINFKEKIALLNEVA